MIIFLYGEDAYRLNRKLADIIGQYKTQKKGLNFKIFDADACGYEEFSGELRQNSIFSERKFLIVKNVFSNKPFKERLLKGAKAMLGGDNVIVVCQDGHILKTDRLLAFLKENAKTQEFPPLAGAKLEAWIKKEFADKGLVIGKEAVDKLVIFIGNDLWRMSNEMEKLASYKFGKNNEVAASEIELLVKPKIEADIFKTIDALAQKNKKAALKLIHDHLEKGDSHHYLLSMVNYQFRNLLMVKSHMENGFGESGDISKRLEMHPYVLRKTMQQSRSFTLSELKNIYRKIFQADIGVKTGKIDPQIALDLLIAEI